MDSGMALVLAALVVFLLVGLVVEYRIFGQRSSPRRVQSTSPDEAPIGAHAPAHRHHASQWYGIDQRTPRAGDGVDVPAPPDDPAQRPHRNTDYPRLDGSVRPPDAQPATDDAADPYTERGRARDIDMLYDPYDGGQSYESPW